MNPVHYHLIVNHVPIFCALFGLLILIFGIAKKSHSINNIAFGLLIVGGIFSYIALKTGHNAEHAMKKEAFFNHEMHERVEAHEHEAEDTYWLAIVAGGLSIIGLFNTKFDQKIQHLVNGATLIFSAIALGFLIYVAYLGGAIRHTEAYQENPTAMLYTHHILQKRPPSHAPRIKIVG